MDIATDEVSAPPPMRPRHPAVRSALAKLGRGETLSDAEAERLEHQLRLLSKPERRHADEPPGDDREDGIDWAARPLRPGRATTAGAARLAARSGNAQVQFHREAGDLGFSSIGLGTYRGPCDSAADRSYVEAIRLALRGGVNFVDTSLNYRFQRSERSVGRAIDAFVADDGGSRDEIVIATKGGFLVPGGFSAGAVAAEEVAGGIHCMSPAFLADQIVRSRDNLGLGTIDIYYLHNPETQLDFVGRDAFLARFARAVEALERAADDGLIHCYGTATWHGYWEDKLSLRTLVETARRVAGDGHRFRFIQLPFNWALDGLLDSAGRESPLDLAADLGLTAIASSSLWEGRLARDLPTRIAALMPGLETDTQRAIQFVRSTPGVASALVGMREPAHVVENLAVARVAPLSTEDFARIRALIA